VPDRSAREPDEPRLLDEEQVLARCEYFVDVQLWPREPVLNAGRWLDNFLADERPYAVHLLGSFQYFADDLTNALLQGAFQGLSRRVADLSAPVAVAYAQWEDFRRSVLITYPTGEQPNPTDSGHTFARKARQVLGIPEQRILSPEATLGFLQRHGARPVVFVDDFLGSGNQFRETWLRDYKAGSATVSFAGLQTRVPFSAFYIPLMATARGRLALTNAAPTVTIAAAHDLPRELSAVHPASIAWPPSERVNGKRAIRLASERAGFPDTGGQHVEDWQGFATQGLAMAFAHSVPDATLPIFHAQRDDWFPLVRRS